jgi:4-amino-4-deoxy-L-arabinose transferase-like glycosyltransferase
VTPAAKRSVLLVLLFACLIYIPSLISPPHLMDDVDAANAAVPRNIIQSGDWVTPHMDNIAYMEKPIGKYWLMAISMEIFGQKDWAARIPFSLSAILLCWLVATIAEWAMGPKAGLYAGLSLATCVGLWLFTRVLIPDVLLTLGIAFSMWAFLRALEPEETRWRWWALAAWAVVGWGILVKGLIAAVFPLGVALFYVFFSGLWRKRETWRRVSIPQGLLAMAAVAGPWIVLATVRNPPYFDFSMHSESGSYHGFFWFFFFNEHILRFLNLRYPRDYDTVPPVLFWLLHFAWFFPWSAFLIRAFRLSYRGEDRASRLRLLCLCWAATVLLFFTFSTTQEYYSMPAYPAFAILIGSAMAESGEKAWKICMRVAGTVAGLAFAAIAFLLWASAGYATPGDISAALTSNPGAYQLSLGHMGDLTLKSFAYLRVPLVVAGLATLLGAIGAWIWRGRRAAWALAAMMVLFFQAARLALIAFDPYLGSYPLADALNHAKPGRLMIDDAYYEVSGIFFYTNRSALILNGRFNNLEYGSYAPGAAKMFIGDADFVERWRSPERWYVASEDEKVKHLQRLVDAESLHRIATAGGKSIYVNRVD